MAAAAAPPLAADSDHPIAVNAFGKYVVCDQPTACLNEIGFTCSQGHSLYSDYCTGYYDHDTVVCDRFRSIHASCACMMGKPHQPGASNLGRCKGKANTCTGAKVMGEHGKRPPVHCHSCVNDWRKINANGGKWTPLPLYATIPQIRKQFMKERNAWRRRYATEYTKYTRISTAMVILADIVPVDIAKIIGGLM